MLLYQSWGGDWAGDRTGTILRNLLYRVFTNRAFSHTLTPLPVPAVTPAVCCNRVAVDETLMFDVRCSRWLPAARHPTVECLARSTADF